MNISGYYGGKAQLAPKILNNFPPHSRYCEPFSGFASVLLNKPRAEIEVLGDLNPGVFETLLDIRNRPGFVINSLRRLPWGRELFESIQGRTDSVATLAHAAMAHHRGGARSGFSQQQSDRNLNRDWNHLYGVSERLQNVKIVNLDWLETLENMARLGWLGQETLVYLDPPYLNGGEHYQHTINPQTHEEILLWCVTARCRVAISGYDSGLYQKYLEGWNKHIFSARSANRTDKTEILWINT